MVQYKDGGGLFQNKSSKKGCIKTSTNLGLFFYLLCYRSFVVVSVTWIDLKLLGCCTRFTCTLIKWYSKLAKKNIEPPAGAINRGKATV